MDFQNTHIVRETRRNLWIMSAVVALAAVNALGYSFTLGQTEFSKILQPDNQPWAAICELASMQDFLDLQQVGAEKTSYFQQFVASLDHASALLIRQLRRALG